MDDFFEFESIRQEYEELKYPGEERRTYPRRKDAVGVRFLNVETFGYLLFTVDIGAGGIRLSTDKPVDMSKDYEVLLLLKSSTKLIKVKAKPVWHRRLNLPGEYYEVGLMFQEIDPEDRQFLIDYAKQKPMRDGSEKRQFLRVPRLLLATLQQDDKKEESFAGLIIDLSEGGARLMTSLSLPTKAKIRLKMELEEGAPVEIPGQVVWGNRVEALRKYQHGIEFVYGVRFEEEVNRVRNILRDYLKFRAGLTEANLVDSLLKLARERKEE